MARQGQRGLTLIELTIGLAIAAMTTGLAIISVQSLTDAALRSAAIELTGAVKFSYDRAIMNKRLQRIGMNLDDGSWWIEFTDDPFSLRGERLSGDEGEQLKTAEELREERDSFFDEDEDQEVKKAMEGGKAASFVLDEDAGGELKLPDGVEFSKVWTGHQEEPFTSGIAYLHFFRGGWTEPAQIELSDGEDFVTLKVSPLTGRVRSYGKQLEDPDVEDDDGREEGDL